MQKIWGSKKVWSQIFYVKKNHGKKDVVKRNLATKCWVQKIYGKKNVGQIIMGQNNLASKEFLVQKKLSQNKCGIKKYFDPKDNLG